MKFFDVLPSSLFQPLVAPGAGVYSTALLRLFAETKRQQRPLSRELAATLIAEILNDPGAMLETRDTEDASLDDESEPTRSRAAAILRYLVRTGWLHEETAGDFARSYVLPDYAFRILRVFEEITNSDSPPLQGLILSIHDLLQAAVRDGNLHIRIPEAHRQTLHLVNHLKELQHNIGAHINGILGEVTTSGVLDHMFTNYHEEIQRRAYHLLHTTEHIGRFHPGILEAIANLEQSDHLVSRDQGNGTDGRSGHASLTPSQLLNNLHVIREQFDTLDGLLFSITQRHGQFVEAAVRAVDRNLAARSTISGQIHSILEHLLTRPPEQQEIERTALVDDLLTLYRLELVDGASLSLPTKAPAVFAPDPTPTLVADEHGIAQARARTRAQLQRVASRSRIQRAALELLRDLDHVRASEIRLAGPEDLSLLIYLRLYGDGALGYQTVELTDRPWTVHNGFGFHDFLLLRSTAAPGKATSRPRQELA